MPSDAEVVLWKNTRPKQELDVHRKEIIQMVKTGSSQKEIAEKYETWPSTVRYWFRKRGIKPEVLRGNKKSTGRKCSSCIYRQLNPNLGNCDYICKTGHSRGCSAINCDKYVKGRPIASMKETVEDYDIFDEWGRKAVNQRWHRNVENVKILSFKIWMGDLITGTVNIRR